MDTKKTLEDLIYSATPISAFDAFWITAIAIFLIMLLISILEVGKGRGNLIFCAKVAAFVAMVLGALGALGTHIGNKNVASTAAELLLNNESKIEIVNHKSGEIVLNLSLQKEKRAEEITFLGRDATEVFVEGPEVKASLYNSQIKALVENKILLSSIALFNEKLLASMHANGNSQ